MIANSENIKNIVRYFRKQAGLSQRELSELAGVGKTVVFDIEQGKESIRLNTLLKILNVLNIELQVEPPFAIGDTDEKS